GWQCTACVAQFHLEAYSARVAVGVSSRHTHASSALKSCHLPLGERGRVGPRRPALLPSCRYGPAPARRAAAEGTRAGEPCAAHQDVGREVGPHVVVVWPGRWSSGQRWRRDAKAQAGTSAGPTTGWSRSQGEEKSETAALLEGVCYAARSTS